MNKAYLLIGGNSGDRNDYLQKAVTYISEKVGKILQLSSLYETAPWGITEQHPFLNQAILIETSLNASQLMTALLEIESIMGRVRTIKFGPRIIDLDIIYFNQDIIASETLTIPHPAMQDRRFVLVPLSEISPDFIHPILQISNQQLLQNCSDPLEVTRNDFSTS